MEMPNDSGTFDEFDQFLEQNNNNHIAAQRHEAAMISWYSRLREYIDTRNDLHDDEMFLGRLSRVMADLTMADQETRRDQERNTLARFYATNVPEHLISWICDELQIDPIDEIDPVIIEAMREVVQEEEIEELINNDINRILDNLGLVLTDSEEEFISCLPAVCRELTNVGTIEPPDIAHQVAQGNLINRLATVINILNLNPHLKILITELIMLY